MGAADGAVYTKQTTKVGDLDVAYFLGGRQESIPPVVYLHGMGATGRWESFHMALGTVALVYAPQFPGWPEGQPPAGVSSIKDYAHLMSAFMDSLGIGEATLVGHSVGAWMAQYLATEQPERFTKLILTDPLGLDMPGVSGTDLGALDDAAFATGVFGQLGLIATADPTGFGAVWENVQQGPEFARQSKGRDMVAKLAGGSYADAALTRAVEALATETLLVWGAVDGLAPLGQGQALQKAMHNAKLNVIDGCGHLPMVEKPETFNRVLHSYLIGLDEPISGVQAS
jgi:pimeloyl-ACP methyl ester carboxylesterase